MSSSNQNPEQLARDSIDKMLEEADWRVQQKSKIDLNDGFWQAVREYQTDVGPVKSTPV